MAPPARQVSAGWVRGGTRRLRRHLDHLAGLSFLIVSPLVLALGVVYVRVVLELVVVLLRIAENTSELVRQGNPAASTERRGYFPETGSSGATPASQYETFSIEGGSEQGRGDEPR